MIFTFAQMAGVHWGQGEMTGTSQGHIGRVPVAPRYLGLGLFWACHMLTVRSATLMHGSTASISAATVCTFASFLSTMTMLLAISSKIENDGAALAHLPWQPFIISSIAGLGGIMAAGLIPDPRTAILLVACGGILAGVGFGYLWGSWANCFGRMRPSRVALTVPVSFFIAAALYLALSIAADNGFLVAGAIAAALPLLSMLCLLRCRKADGCNEPFDTDPVRTHRALGSLASLIVASMIMSCLMGFIWEITMLERQSVTEAHQLPLFANLIVAGALTVFVAVSRRSIDLELAFKAVIPVVAVVLFAVPVLGESNPLALNTAMTACFWTINMVIWYSVAAAAYDYNVPGFVLGGVVFALVLVTRMLGIGLGYLFSLIPNRPALLFAGISAGTLYLLAMAVFFHRTRRAHAAADRPDEQPASDPAAKDPAAALPDEARDARQADDARDAHEDAICAFARDFNLTRREAEVLPYLAKGRSAKVIAEALFVSEPTIRTHTRNILEKADLHSKQELISLIERY